MNARRVVITGIGAVSPLGLSFEKSWQALLANQSGVKPISRFDATKFSTRIASEISDFNPQDFDLSSKDTRKMARFIQLSLAASRLALTHARLPLRFEQDRANKAVYIASGMGGLPEVEEWSIDLHKKMQAGGKTNITPFFVPMTIPNMAAGQVSLATGAQGPNMCHVTACASSAHAIGEAYRLIQGGSVDLVISGGAEAVISPVGISGFASMKALSEKNESPSEASRPYDAQRDGFVMGEGACVLILESLDHALKRQASILAEIVGYGANSDAHHMTSPAPEGEGAMQCMKAAIRESGASVDAILYVNAHATSTPTGDVLEAQGIARTFRDRRERLLVSSTKSMTGHLLGAAGAFEAAVCVQTLLTGKVVPTLNLNELDPALGGLRLNFCPANQAPKHSDGHYYNLPNAEGARYVMTNSFGFGGTNACLVLKSYDSK